MQPNLCHGKNGKNGPPETVLVYFSLYSRFVQEDCLRSDWLCYDYGKIGAMLTPYL